MKIKSSLRTLIRLLLLSLLFNITYGRYILIHEFEKVIVKNFDNIYYMQYIQKDNETFAYSGLILNIEYKSNLDFDIELLLGYEYRIVTESSSLYFNESVIDEDDNQIYLDFSCFEVDSEKYEYFEFSIFFINDEIPFDINTNNYIFKFIDNNESATFSQDFLLFKIPMYECDKTLKIKMQLENDNYDDLFIIKNLKSFEETSYNKKIFSDKLLVSKFEYYIKINHISEIKLLYISLDDEIIDLTNITEEKYIIFNSQRFYINLLNSKIGFLISPYETAKNAKITFYNREMDKIKERDLEPKKTSFYIEKIDDISEYYIDIKVDNYIAYKFNVMENYEIINKSCNITIPAFSTKYFIFPYNIQKENNNKFFYGIDYQDISYRDALFEIINEFDDNSYNFWYIGKFVLFRSHFIIKTLSLTNKAFQAEVLYTNEIVNNIRIYYPENKSKILQLINNGGIYSNETINEYILLYTYYYQYINFQGTGQFLYYDDILNFKMFKNGLNLEKFDSINLFKNDLNSIPYILIYINVKVGDYYQTNICPDPKLNSEKEYNSYCILDQFSKVFNDDGYLFYNSNGEEIKNMNVTIGEYTQNYIVKRSTEFLYHKKGIVKIKTSGPIIISYVKIFQNDNLRFIGIDHWTSESYSRFLKVIIPNIKENYTFYRGFGFFDSMVIGNPIVYTNEMKEFNIPLNSDEEISIYMKTKPNQGIPYDSIIYGFNKDYYPKNLNYKAVGFSYEGYHTGSFEDSLFSWYSNYTLYKCKNTKVKISIGTYIGNGISHKEFIEEDNENFHNLFLSKYNQDSFLVVGATEDFLLFKGMDSRNNNNIRSDVEEYFSTEVSLSYEEPITYTKKKYIFAPNNDYYMENFMNECFLYRLIDEKITDKNISITNNPDCIMAIQKEYQEYLATVVYYNYKSNIYSTYFFYKPTIIKLSKDVYDKFFPPETLISKKNLYLLIGIGIGIIILVVICIKCSRKKNLNSSSIEENIEKVDNLKLI